MEPLYTMGGGVGGGGGGRGALFPLELEALRILG